MDSTSSSTSTRPSQAALVEVEVEAQSTRLIEIRWILTFIMITSLYVYRNTELYIKANLIDLSDLVSIRTKNLVVVVNLLIYLI